MGKQDMRCNAVHLKVRSEFDIEVINEYRTTL